MQALIVLKRKRFGKLTNNFALYLKKKDQTLSAKGAHSNEDIYSRYR